MKNQYIQFIKNKKIIIPVSIVIILFIIYFVICLMAGSGDFVSRTTINGINVGQMTKQEAVTALNKLFEKDTLKLLIQMKANETHYTIDLTDNVSFEATQEVKKISQRVQGHFLTRAYYNLFDHDYVIPVKIKDQKKLKQAIKESQILEYDTTQKTTYTLENQKIIFTKGKNGEKVSEAQTIKDIENAFEQYEFKKEIVCQLEPTYLEEEMKSLHQKLVKKVQNASLDKNNDYTIIPSQIGIEYNLEEAQKAFLKTESGKTFAVAAAITQPTITTEDLENNLFKDTLGSYSTYVTGSSVRKNNVRLAGLKCNSILLPGEEFSFNEQVGERTTARGFGAAGAYRDGETVNEVGGGVCQSSSTLYNAVLLSNLEVTLRYNHSYISSYVPIGRDATVSWGGPDFRFKNNQAYPIKILMSYSGSRLYCKILGTNLDGSYVKMTSKQISSTPFQTQYIDDPTLEVGKEKVQTSGYNGARAQSYRYVYDKNGNLISSKKEAYSIYKKRDKVVRRGTKPVEMTPEQTETETPVTDSNQILPETQYPQIPVVQ